MVEALIFCRRSTDMQGLSLADQRVLAINWLQTAPMAKELEIDPEPARVVTSTATGSKTSPELEEIMEEDKKQS